MARNVILLTSTLAVLLLLFVGYSSLVGTPQRERDAAADAGAALPAAIHVADEHKLPVGPIDVEPGEEMAYVRYGPDGRPTDYFRLETWEKVPGKQNEVLVTRPELMMRLAGGLIVTVTAERGQIKAERPERDRLRPQFGWLAGNARIVVDRAPSSDGPPLSARPEDAITIEMDRLHFDLELGELKTAEPLRVSTPEFEITGTGLHLIWNQADNRVEKLVIEQGGRMVLRSDLLATLDTAASGNADVVSPSPAAPELPASAPASTPSERAFTAYRCVLSGGVTIDHYVDDNRLGGLRADELTLLFDVGRGGRELGRGERGPDTAPGDRKTDGPPRRLVVQWNRRLTLGPAEPLPPSQRPRRRLEAHAQPLVVELPNGSVECGRFILHEETRRLWLYPVENGLVELSTPRGLSVRAASLFADLRDNTVKLLGDVSLRSGAGAGGRAQTLAIRCNLWAELRLAPQSDRPTAESVFDNPLTSRPPESAAFVGDVLVRYGEQTVRAHRLDARFRRATEHGEPRGPLEPAAATVRNESGHKTPALQTLLESVVATGDVQLIAGDSSGHRGWLGLFERRVKVFKRALVRSLAPATPAPAGAGVAEHDRWLECAWLRLGFAARGGEVRVRELEASGAVNLRDRDSRFAARGRRVAATFTGQEELEQAAVSGSERVPALVRARAYALRGGEINVDNQARTLHIDGPSTLAFRSRRSLRGEIRREPETITVASNESLHIAEEQNTVDFIGQVVAGTGDEQLLADSLKLLLEDAPVERSPDAWAGLRDLVRMMRGKLLAEAGRSEGPRPLLRATRSGEGVRKELARILAHNAVIQSEVYAAGDDLPLVHQSIAAAELEIDVRQRWLHTTGVTTLVMMDRRLPDGGDPDRAPLGVPSALMTRGPSKTAMECRRSLTYVLGEEGPQRKDSVLLEGLVRFRHVAGRETPGLEQMLPELTADPERLAGLRSGNTYLECGRLEGIFAATDDSGRGGTVRRQRPSLQPVWLNACEHVWLRDQQDANIRSVYAHQLEYDRQGGVIRVLGSRELGVEARIFDENAVTGRFSNPAISPEIIIDLKTNTIRAKDIRGQVAGG